MQKIFVSQIWGGGGVLEEARREHQIPLGAEVTGGCEMPKGHWTLNSGPKEEHQAPLTTGPSLQLPPPKYF